MPVQTDHPDFPAPPNLTTIWRYSSLSKLLALMLKQELFLASVPSLRTDDPFEGAITLADMAIRKELMKPGGVRQVMGNFFEGSPEAEQYMLSTLGKGQRPFSDLCFVSCWHVSAYESAALWKLYSVTADGVAIRSKVGKLAAAVKTDRELILGAVQYADFEQAQTPVFGGQALVPVFRKRQSFEHEKELRLLFWAASEWGRDDRFPWVAGDRYDDLPRDFAVPPGVSFPCDTKELIDEVVVSPTAAPWMVETVTLVLERLGFNCPVRRSTLLDPPS